MDLAYGVFHKDIHSYKVNGMKQKLVTALFTTHATNDVQWWLILEKGDSSVFWMKIWLFHKSPLLFHTPQHIVAFFNLA